MNVPTKRSLGRLFSALGVFLTAYVVSSTLPARAVRLSGEDLMLDSFAAMEEFARCMPRFEIASAIAGNAKKMATAEEYAGTARGAYAVSLYFAMQLAAEESETPDLFQERLDYRIEQVEGFVEVERIAQYAELEMGEIDWDGLKYCHDIQPLQIKVIELMRRDGLL